MDWWFTNMDWKKQLSVEVSLAFLEFIFQVNFITRNCLYCSFYLEDFLLEPPRSQGIFQLDITLKRDGKKETFVLLIRIPIWILKTSTCKLNGNFFIWPRTKLKPGTFKSFFQLSGASLYASGMEISTLYNSFIQFQPVCSLMIGRNWILWFHQLRKV